MRELHHKDGRPFSFDRTTVRFIEPHETGEGSLLVLGPKAGPRSVHVAEDYDAVRKEVLQSDWDRTAEQFLSRGRSSDDDELVPF
ncbi:hypothetical protein [Sphingomonas sp. CARO-RG-8B-R24-01]|uniref:hypothetical protein n=1 Tax=Sphingomonas sp. CARO-RG-8B-R24-01 TaxID=2914831 RepID=UPI001F5A9615|nr:hypothetical protein [Sphingomonas sp. CARO-RG-8B-R24-01]